eukprot:SAG31_NODE_28001_length_416_cov_13.441640_1_plen_29_part_10
MTEEAGTSAVAGFRFVFGFADLLPFLGGM